VLVVVSGASFFFLGSDLLPEMDEGGFILDYLTPPGSSLQEQQGWQPRGKSNAFAHEVWAGFFTLSYGHTNTVTLTWTEKGIAKKDAAGWHYQYLVQRQAGSNWMLNVQVTLPSCVVRKHTPGGHISQNGQTMTLTQALIEDANLGIDYRC